MKNSSVSLWFLTATLFASPLFAAEPAPGEDRLAPEKTARRERLLQRFDGNRDDKLDEAERTVARQNLRQHQRRQARMKHHQPRARVRARFDRDADGRLDAVERTEVRQALRQVRQRRHAHRAELRQRFDANHDGQLDRGEREQARRAWQEFLHNRKPAPAGG